MSRVVAMDCEMVGSGNRSILARVTIVDETGKVVLDEYVKPTGPVTDYRGSWSEAKKRHLEKGSDFSIVRSKVAKLINGCILVGHSLQFDLEVLNLSYPSFPKSKRDLAHVLFELAKYNLFIKNNGGQPVALKDFARDYYLKRIIQNGEHDSADDAKACMHFYHSYPFEPNDLEKKSDTIVDCFTM